MKVAVSIPDDLFRQADQLAEETGSTRSALYARALSEFLRKRRDDAITEKLNKALADIDQEEDLPFVRKAASAMLRRQEW